MPRLAYFGVLVFIVVGSGWLEVVMRTNVLRRSRRFVLALAPVLALFLIWDAYAIAAGHWTFDPDRTTGVTLLGSIPLEELVFFVVVPFAAVLTLEAVRSARGWSVGDEPPGEQP
ncbi:MAG: lycopene cyclase domain-containing protein [Actinomycetes bacterium]